MAQPNTITANITLSDKGPERCVATAILAEIIERLQGTVTFDDPSVAIISRSQPTQLNKIWFQINSLGVVTNIKFFNTSTGKWEDVVSTGEESNEVCLAAGNNAITKVGDCIFVDNSKFLERSTSSNNLLQFDDDGKLIVDISVVKDIAVSIDEEYACNILHKNSATKELRVKRGAGAFLHLGNPSGGLVEGYLIEEDAPDPATQTTDLEAVLPSFWDADCPPTHVQVTGVIAIGVGDAFSGGTWAVPAAVIEAGFDNTRIAFSLDSDNQEGATINTAIVRLNPNDPKTFAWKTDGRGTVAWGDPANKLALYLQAFIWGGPPT